MTYRVAMVGACPYFVPQGSQVYLRDTALGLRERGHEVHLVVYGYGLGDDGTSLPVHRGATVPGARKTAAGPSLAKPFLDLALAATLRQVVRDARIDIVHAHNYEGLLVALAARKRPIVYHAHNAMADELPYYFRGRRAAQRLGAWLDRAFPRRADHVIVPHAALAEYLVACGCTLSRVSVVPPPMNVELFEACRVEEALPPVLYAGNLDAYQNLELLERAMERVRAALPEARLVIATGHEGPFPAAEVIPAAGFDALRRVLATDAVFACPRVSWSGYPIKLLNAMAAGMACVACQGAAHPLTHEENGLVVPDNDEAAFAEALISLLTRPERRRQLGQNARQTTASRHDPGQIAARIEQVYSGLSC